MPSKQLLVRLDYVVRTVEIAATCEHWSIGMQEGPVAHFSWEVFEAARNWLSSAPSWSLTVIFGQDALLKMGKVNMGLIGFQLEDQTEGARSWWGGRVGSPESIGKILDEIESLRPERYVLAHGGTPLEKPKAPGKFAMPDVQPLAPREGYSYVSSSLRDISVGAFEWTLYFTSFPGGWRLCALDSAESFFGWETILRLAGFIKTAAIYDTFCAPDDSRPTDQEHETNALYVVILQGRVLLGYQGVDGAWSGLLDDSTFELVIGELRRHYECWHGRTAW